MGNTSHAMRIPWSGWRETFTVETLYLRLRCKCRVSSGFFLLISPLFGQFFWSFIGSDMKSWENRCDFFMFEIVGPQQRIKDRDSEFLVCSWWLTPCQMEYLYVRSINHLFKIDYIWGIQSKHVEASVHHCRIIMHQPSLTIINYPLDSSVGPS